MKSKILFLLKNCLCLTVVYLCLIEHCNAQFIMPYHTNFEAIGSTNAPSKNYASLDTVTLNGMKWVLPGTYLGSPEPGMEHKIGLRAARMRLTNNTTGTAGSMFMAQDLASGIGTLTFQAAMYGSQTLDSLNVMYSVNAGVTWIYFGTTGNLDTILKPYTFVMNIPGNNVRIKIEKATNQNKRINIDEIFCSNVNTSLPISLVEIIPDSGQIQPGLYTLKARYSDNIIQGINPNAKIKLINTTLNIVQDSFYYNNILLTNNRLSFNSVLANNTYYTVTIDSSFFKNIQLVNSTVVPQGIWTFNTADTMPPPIIPPVLTVVNNSPIGNNILLSTNTLTIQYSHNITQGANTNAKIKLKNMTSGVVVDSFTFINATVTNGNLVQVPVTLNNNTAYAVQVDSGFVKINNSVVNNSLISYNNWTFHTVDTITVQPVSPFHIIFNSPVGFPIASSVNQLTIHFNETVFQGLPNKFVKLIDISNNQMIDSFTYNDATILDSIVTFPVTLANNKGYNVTIDSGMFSNNLNQMNTIIDTQWMFWTQDSLILPNYTSINETFQMCNTNQNQLGNTFRQFNASGNEKWHCSTYGYYDNHSVMMYGGGAIGSLKNEDWLISNAKIDLSNYISNIINLNFYEKIRNTGAVNLKCKISTNYDGISNPKYYTWIDLDDYNEDSIIIGEWFLQSLNLLNYKNTPFYLALTYTSDENNVLPFEVYYDAFSISTTPNNVSIKNKENNIQEVTILGYPSTSTMHVAINLKNSEILNFELYDLMGKKVFEIQKSMNSGKSEIILDRYQVVPGMYLLRINNETYRVAIKAVIR